MGFATAEKTSMLGGSPHNAYSQPDKGKDIGTILNRQPREDEVIGVRSEVMALFCPTVTKIGDITVTGTMTVGDGPYGKEYLLTAGSYMTIPDPGIYGKTAITVVTVNNAKTSGPGADSMYGSFSYNDYIGWRITGSEYTSISTGFGNLAFSADSIAVGNGGSTRNNPINVITMDFNRPFNRLKIFNSGIPTGNTTTNLGTSTHIGRQDGLIKISAAPATYDNLVGFPLAYVIPRCVSDDEAKSLLANPWQIFKKLPDPKPQPIPQAPALITKKVRTSQPQGYVPIDWKNPLSDDLVEYTIVTSSGLLTLAGTTSSPIGSTPVSSGISLSGKTRRSNAVSSIQCEEAPLPQFITSETTKGITLYCRARILAYGSSPTSYASSRAIYGITYNTSTGGVGISIVNSNSPGSFCYGGSVTANRTTVDIVITQGKEYDVFATHPAGSGIWTCEVMGVGTATSTAQGVDNISGATLVLPAVRTGYNASTVAPGDKELIVGGFWLRVLTDSEKRQIASNPWQLFAPQPSYTFTPGG
jgi:hypothetical protein